MSVVYSTHDVETNRAFEYWADLVCDVYVGLDCNSGDRATFSATVSCFDLASVRLSMISGSGHRAVRSSKRLAESPSDDVFAHLQIAGRTSVIQDNRRADLDPYDLVFYDASREYEIVAEPNFRTVVFQLPRRSIGMIPSEIDAAVGRRFDGRSGLGRPLARFLAAVPDACAESQGDSGVIEHSTVDLLRMALQLTAPSKTSARTSTLSLRAKQLVEDRLDDPDFDREELAAALGMSVRALSRLFSSARTSPSEYIRSRRLERCRYALLETKMASLTVTEVAFANGFNDSSHFSSAFRKAYGMSPRDYRADPAGLTRRGSRPQKV